MKKTFFLIILFFITIFPSLSFSQEIKTVNINAGTPIQIICENGLRASEVQSGDNVEFRVLSPIKVDDITAIPYNSLVRANVIKAKKSKIFGIKGKLRIKIIDILLPNGESVPLATKELNFDGDSRVGWVVPIGILLCWPILFVPGERAEINPGYTTVVNVAVDTKIKVKN